MMKRCARTLSTEELSRDVEGLAAHDNNLLSLEELLRNGRGEATEKVALAIDGDLFSTPVSFLFPLSSIFPKVSSFRKCDVLLAVR
jgi:hypothetical protein